MEVFENGGSASVWTGENGGSASLCGRAKTEVFENDYVTDIGMSQLKKQNGYFLIRFRWSSVDGRKGCKNASVDETLFIRFRETENGGFRKRISVDRADFHVYYPRMVIKHAKIRVFVCFILHFPPSEKEIRSGFFRVK